MTCRARTRAAALCVAATLSTGPAVGHADAERVIGRSHLGRAITVSQLGDPGARVRVLVVGAVHGNEVAGIAIARRLAHLRIPDGVAIWTVANLNPDGSAAGTRQNARGVDLNRNFPFAWRRLGAPGSTFHSGSAPASEPETRVAAALVRQVRPTISIWFHQALDLVDVSGGRTALSRRYAGRVGMRAVRLPRYPGSATGWQNRRFTGSTAFVVELPGGRARASVTERHARAIVALAGDVARRAPDR